MNQLTFSAQPVSQGSKTFWLTKIPAGILTQISYAAVRGKSDEIGAVQRVLNIQRISSLKQFALRGGDYPVTVVINWVLPNDIVVDSNANTLSFFPKEKSVQIIDGQHRIAGLAAAIQEEKGISSLEVPAAIYVGLTTTECADIFLAINTEQRPAPKSLVYDLFGISSAENADINAVRARDIALYLNESEASPYYQDIKMPGQPMRKGGIALSTAVTAIKPLVEPNGDFHRINMHELELQKQAIINYSEALKYEYGSHWESKKNAFKYASGFSAAMRFLSARIIPYCRDQKSFKIETIRAVLQLNKAESGLIFQDEVKGLGGSEATNRVYQRLDEAFVVPRDSPVDFQFS